MSFNEITRDLGIPSPYEDIFSPDGKNVELSSIKEWIKTERSYQNRFKTCIPDSNFSSSRLAGSYTYLQRWKPPYTSIGCARTVPYQTGLQ